MCSAFSHTDFGIEGLFRSRGGFFEVHDSIRAIDSFERERVDQFLPLTSALGHFLETIRAGKGN